MNQDTTSRFGEVCDIWCHDGCNHCPDCDNWGDYGCIDGISYGPCGHENCYGMCEYLGRCDCECHSG